MSVAQEVVFVWFGFSFSWKSESTTLSSKTFQRKKTMVTKGQNHPLTGRAGSRI